MADITFRLCKCGVRPAHGRFFDEGGNLYTVPFFSKEKAREWGQRVGMPPDLLEHLLAESTLADTDQQAWDNLPEEMKVDTVRFWVFK